MKRKPQDVRIIARVPEGIKGELNELGECTGINESHWIRLALREFFRSHKTTEARLKASYDDIARFSKGVQ